MKKAFAGVLLGVTATLLSFQANAAFQSCIATSVCDQRVREAAQTSFAQGRSEGVAAGIGSCQTDPASCGITLQSLLPPADYGETELNDNMVAADPLRLGARYWGQSYGPEDQDWYFLIADRQNKIMTIVFDVPDRDPASASAADWIVTVRDAAGNVYARFNTDFLTGNPLGDDAIAYPIMLGLAGTYYVVVQPQPDKLSYYPYNLMVKLEDSTLDHRNFLVGSYDVEREPNDTWDVANRIVSFVTVYGMMNVQFEEAIPQGATFVWGQGDPDWFVYTSPGNEVVTLSFCERERCSAGNWFVEVFQGPDRLAAFNTDVTSSSGPSVFRMGFNDPGEYFMLVNHKRKYEAPCRGFRIDVNNDGVISNGEGDASNACGCETGSSCSIKIPNPNRGLCPDGSGTINEDTGAGPNQCDVTCRCTSFGVLLEVPDNAVTSQYNFTWAGTNLSPDTGSTDAYQDFLQRPGNY